MVAGLALSCAASLAVPAAWATDPDGTDGPDGSDGSISRQDVDDAESAVDAAAADVESVRGKLAAAQQRLESTQVDAAKASEAFNGARYEAQQATQASRLAQERAVAAAADLERQRAAYADAAVAAYQFSPQLTALGAISEADGITEVLESTAALQNAESALQGRYDAYDAADALAQGTHGE